MPQPVEPPPEPPPLPPPEPPVEPPLLAGGGGGGGGSSSTRNVASTGASRATPIALVAVAATVMATTLPARQVGVRVEDEDRVVLGPRGRCRRSCLPSTVIVKAAFVDARSIGVVKRTDRSALRDRVRALVRGRKRTTVGASTVSTAKRDRGDRHAIGVAHPVDDDGVGRARGERRRRDESVVLVASTSRTASIEPRRRVDAHGVRQGRRIDRPVDDDAERGVDGSEIADLVRGLDHGRRRAASQERRAAGRSSAGRSRPGRRARP